MTTRSLRNHPIPPVAIDLAYRELLEMGRLTGPGGVERARRWLKTICGMFDYLSSDLNRLPTEILATVGIDPRSGPFLVPTIIPVMGPSGGRVHAFAFNREGDTLEVMFPFDREVHFPRVHPDKIESHLREYPAGVEVRPWTGAIDQLPAPHHVLNNLSSLIVALRDVRRLSPAGEVTAKS